MNNSYELIVATDLKEGISKNGTIPWNIPEDLVFFKETTQNSIVLMGRNTYFSLPEKNRPLKNRLNVVFTREPDTYKDIEVQNKNVLFVNNFENFDLQFENKKIFIIGGSQIYNMFYSKCSVIWLTKIKKDYDCDLKLDSNKILANFEKVSIVKETEEFIIEKYMRNKVI
jgi:dihydrofolate reductase